jgi:hypothetical protein
MTGLGHSGLAQVMGNHARAPYQQPYTDPFKGVLDPIIKGALLFERPPPPLS